MTVGRPGHHTPIGFDYEPHTRIVFGAGVVGRTGELARGLVGDGATALLVTDEHLVRVGHVERAQRALEQAGLRVVVYAGVRENPTTADVGDCLQVARDAEPALIVGVGGGSSMDTAKGCNFLLTNGGRMQDYWGVGLASRPMLPLIAIPTTAGTGSECQSFALIADVDTHAKMACGDPKAAARIAVLDPALTLTQPRLVTADTGIDAVAHATETAVTLRRNDLSLLYSREAFKLTVNNLALVLDRPDDLEARGRMLLGAAYSGLAIEMSMLGAAHSAANPLTARFGVVHGQAVGIMLPHVVRFNSQDPAAARAYAEHARIAGLSDNGDGPQQAVDKLVARLEALLDAAQVPASLSTFGVTAEAIDAMAQEAVGQWTASFNPRAASADDFVNLYQSALRGRQPQATSAACES